MDCEFTKGCLKSYHKGSKKSQRKAQKNIEKLRETWCLGGYEFLLSKHALNLKEVNNDWTKRKIKDTIQAEKELLRKVFQRIESKIEGFEKKYGKLERKNLYGKIEDMELLEWEGEIETAARLREKLTSFEEIIIEYK